MGWQQVFRSCRKSALTQPTVMSGVSARQPEVPIQEALQSNSRQTETRVSQEQVGHSNENRHPERSRRMTTTGQRLSHGSTPLTMTFTPLGTAHVDLLRQPQRRLTTPRESSPSLPRSYLCLNLLWNLPILGSGQGLFPYRLFSATKGKRFSKRLLVMKFFIIAFLGSSHISPFVAV